MRTGDIRRQNSLHQRCLGSILKVGWCDRMSNEAIGDRHQIARLTVRTQYPDLGGLDKTCVNPPTSGVTNEMHN